MVKILYFSWVRDAIGLAEEQLALPDTMRDMRDISEFLAARSVGHGAALADLSRLRFAVDQVMANLDTPIGNATEIAIFPPVTGG